MNEDEFQKLIQSIDQELISNELDELLENTDFDFESISNKAWDKFNNEIKKETLDMDKLEKPQTIKKKNIFKYPLVAASLVAVLGTTIVYGDQISEFIKSILNKKQVYSTIVDGKAFYLPTPVKLNDSFELESVSYSKDKLTIVLIPKERIEEIKNVFSLGLTIKDRDLEYMIASGALYDDNRIAISFSNTGDPALFTPSNLIKLNFPDKTYDIKLSEAEDLTSKGEVKEGVSKTPDVSIGYQKSDDGILIITNFDDANMNLMSIGAPLNVPLKTIVDFTNNKGSGGPTITKNLIGVDEKNNNYEFEADNNGNSFPVTLFKPTKEIPAKIKLQIPSLIINYKKETEIPNLKLGIPNVGEEVIVNKEFDLILQKMVLDKIIRTSNTTAELKLTLNTGDRKDIEIRDVFCYPTNVKTIESTWEENTCTMVLTIDENVKETDLTISSPLFTINGDWVLDIE